MSSVLILKSSILGEHSQSAVLADYLMAHLQHQGASITVRDLAADALPMCNGDIASALRGGDSLSLEQQKMLSLSDTLVNELKAHDLLVLAAPMYNFGIPVQLKNWIDFIARAGVTFTYTDSGPKGLIQGKKAVILSSRGGVHKDGPNDHVVPYLTTVLKFIGIDKIDTIYAEALNMGSDASEQSIATAKKQLDALMR